jgi:hypothetical protein
MNTHPALNLLAEKFIETYCKTFPVESTYFGLTEHYPLLGYPKEEQVQSFITFLESLSKEIETISHPNEHDKIDEEVLQFLIDLELFKLRTLPHEESMISPVQLVLHGVHGILDLRISDRKKLEYIISRLQHALPLFSELRCTWKTATSVALEDALLQMYNLEKSLTIMLTPIMNTFPQETPSIKDLIAAVTQKGSDFAYWLENEVKPHTTLTCRVLGKENYENLLKIRRENHNWKERLHIGEISLKRSKNRLKNLAQTMVQEGTIDAALSAVRNDLPENHLEASHTAHKRVKTFLEESDLLRVPDFQCEITEPPDWDPFWGEGMLGVTFAEILGKTPLLKINVAPPQTEKGKKELNHSFILLAIAHEGVAGHLSSFVLRKRRNNLIRLLVPLTTGMDDRWTFYWEQLLQERGIQPTAEYRFYQEYRVFWCSLRHICDVSLHCNLMSFEECVRFLEKEADAPFITAKSYAKLIAQMPGYFSSFIVGKNHLIDLREYTRRQLGGHYSPALFHRWIGEAGPIPYPLLEREIKERIRQIAAT